MASQTTQLTTKASSAPENITWSLQFLFSYLRELAVAADSLRQVEPDLDSDFAGFPDQLAVQRIKEGNLVCPALDDCLDMLKSESPAKKIFVKNSNSNTIITLPRPFPASSE